MSARMAVFTEDEQWVQRYYDHVPLLDEALETIKALSSEEAVRQFANDIENVNAQLIEKEERAFALIKAGDKVGAAKILFDPNYVDLKQQYTKGYHNLFETAYDYVERINHSHEREHHVFLGFLSLLLLFSLTYVFYMLRRAVAYEGELKSQSELLHTYLDHMPGPVYSKSAENGRYLYINRVFKESVILQVDPEDVVGLTDMDIYPQEVAMPLIENDRKVAEQNKTVFAEEVVPHPDGSLRTYHTWKFPVPDAKGKIIAVTGISIDVSEKVMLEKQLDQEKAKALQAAKLATLGEMAAGVAHEINNPLAIVAGHATVLEQSGDLSQDQQKSVSTIQRSVERISAIVRGLKKFARDGGHSKRDFYDINRIYEESLILVQNRAHKHGVKIQADLKATKQVYVNDIEIEQVIVNLINNAVDAVSDSEDNWVRVESYDDVDGSVHFKVVDSGSGLNEETVGKLFEPFYTNKPVGEGTGLGLSISKGIIEDHGGFIRYCPRNPNTCFCFTLPTKKPDA